LVGVAVAAIDDRVISVGELDFGRLAVGQARCGIRERTIPRRRYDRCLLAMTRNRCVVQEN
jgi:hypothetical protein